ncbi:hypothetical protein EZS27_043072, partial [termite gut metagenome]
MFLKNNYLITTMMIGLKIFNSKLIENPKKSLILRNLLSVFYNFL